MQDEFPRLKDAKTKIFTEAGPKLARLVSFAIGHQAFWE
jgi:hypothetical protein